MSEEYIVSFGAPTLAGLKTGSLFNCEYESKAQILSETREFNRRLAPKGIRLIPLRFTQKRALMLLYRPRRLSKDLSSPLARRILRQEGYVSVAINAAIPCLIRRLGENEEFPHEIGLFLGYPPEDVEGFIQHRGKNSLLTGIWKVYGDVESAEREFRKIRKCNDIYRRSYSMGNCFDRLAVAEK